MIKTPRNEILTMGVDEAGRGCVLGPLVVAVVAATECDRRWFNRVNVTDSKRVSPPRREALATEIRSRCWYWIAVALPTEIDEAVRDRSTNLNGLELRLMSDCLRHAHETHHLKNNVALVDCPSINIRAFTQQLLQHSDWPDPKTLRAAHHADRDNRTVGAASIIAKSERERLIAQLKQYLGVDFGSGYCHDPRTIAHLQTVAPSAPHVRWSWRTTHAPHRG